MPQDTVWTTRYQLLAWDNDDPNGPTPSKRRQDPKSRDLQDNEEGEEDGNDLMVIGKQPHPSQPSGMQQNNKRKMRPAVLHTTGGQQPPLVRLAHQNSAKRC